MLSKYFALDLSTSTTEQRLSSASEKAEKKINKENTPQTQSPKQIFWSASEKAWADNWQIKYTTEHILCSVGNNGWAKD